ncbi:MAG: NnrU family protein [Candidatus Binatia bacterium]
MEAAAIVTALWIVFGGTHIGLATGASRDRLVRRFGEWGFVGIYSVVAAASFALLLGYFATHRFVGAGGLGLGGNATVRWILIALISFGLVLAIVAVLGYPRSTYAVPRRTSRPEPYGVERITRHGFFVGLALFGLAHALLATHLIGTVFFAELLLFTVVGARHQDTKTLVLRGQAHADYIAVTSSIPFAAILSGRQRLVWRELSLPILLLAILLVWQLSRVHESIFAYDGSLAIGFVVGGAAMALADGWRRERKFAARTHRLGRPAP